jgi:AraC-like DNA-binding protein
VRAVSLDVLSYLPAPLQSHLRVVLGGTHGHILTAADRWEGFIDELRRATSDVVVVDPCADGVSRAAALAVALDAHPATPVVIYTPVSPLSFRAIAELGRHSAHHAVHQIVLHRYDDEPRRFLEMLERQPGNALSVALLDRLAPALADLPPALTRAVERLVRQPTDFHDVGDLASAARVTIRTAYRHLAGAGFTSPRALLVGARLLRAYAYARDPRQSLEAIAAKVGYSAPRMMAKHMREVIGVTPRAVRRQVRPWEFVDTLATWLCSPPAPAIALSSRRIAPRRIAARPPGRIADAAHLWDHTVHVLADAAPAPDAARSLPALDTSWPDQPSRPRLA